MYTVQLTDAIKRALHLRTVQPPPQAEGEPFFVHVGVDLDHQYFTVWLPYSEVYR